MEDRLKGRLQKTEEKGKAEMCQFLGKKAQDRLAEIKGMVQIKKGPLLTGQGNGRPALGYIWILCEITRKKIKASNLQGSRQEKAKIPKRWPGQEQVQADFRLPLKQQTSLYRVVKKRGWWLDDFLIFQRTQRVLQIVSSFVTQAFFQPFLLKPLREWTDTKWQRPEQKQASHSPSLSQMLTPGHSHWRGCLPRGHVEVGLLDLPDVQGVTGFLNSQERMLGGRWFSEPKEQIKIRVLGIRGDLDASTLQIGRRTNWRCLMGSVLGWWALSLGSRWRKCYLLYDKWKYQFFRTIRGTIFHQKYI